MLSIIHNACIPSWRNAMHCFAMLQGSVCIAAMIIIVLYTNAHLTWICIINAQSVYTINDDLRALLISITMPSSTQNFLPK